MFRTLEAVIDEQGNVRLLEPIALPAPQRALVTVLEEASASQVPETALLSEAALAEDWNRPEEDAAWSHLQARAVVLALHAVFLAFAHEKRRSQEETTVDPAAIRGLGTTLLASVGCLPQESRDEYPRRVSSRHRGLYHTGAAPLPMHVGKPSQAFLTY